MLLLKDNCSLCDRVFPHFALRRCYRCRRLYCRDCTTYTKDGEIICLNCARRIVSPKKLGTKYSPFSRYLLRRAKYTSQVTLSFAKIEGIITDNLPFGAIRSQEWWKNTSSTSQGRAWLNIGWKVQDVDLNKRIVTLARDADVELRPRKRRKRRKKSTHAFKLPTKPKRRRIPSKTKIAKVQARARNVERRKSSMKRYKSKNRKARTRDQYRLWDETAKPSETKD